MMFGVKSAAVVAAAGALVFGLAACGGTTEAVEAGSASAETEAPAAEPSPIAPTVGDFAIKLKVTSQQCFGSAGCNVEVKPKLTLMGNVPDEGTVDITYRVSGDESGPIIETMTLDLASQMYDTSEILMSTTSSAVTPKAKVSDVEFTP